MPLLKVRNFGPITVGYRLSSGFMDLKRLSLFIGPQGSGKSTVVKLLSLFTWLEKRHATNDTEADNIDFHELLEYHNIEGYLGDKTELAYKGDCFEFSYKGGKLEKRKSDSSYVRPKILYVPADRVFCSAIKNPGRIAGLPKNTFDFLLDFTDAEHALKKVPFNVPINGFQFYYDDQQRYAFLQDRNRNYTIDISSASSGILSALPMTLTIAYFSGFLAVRPMQQSLDQVMKTYADVQARLDTIKSAMAAVETLGLEHSSEQLDADKKQVHDMIEKVAKLASDLKTPEKIIGQLVNSRLVSIVEEPEQNLFPEAQADVLYYLIRCMNSGSVLGGENSLAITTHSPYIVEALNNSIYAKRLADDGENIEGLLDENELVSYADISAYKLSDGEIVDIKDDDLRQVDAGYLDSCSERIRRTYSRLEDIEFADA